MSFHLKHHSFDCNICKRSFATIRSLASHKNHHNPEYRVKSKAGALATQKIASDSGNKKRRSQSLARYVIKCCKGCQTELPYEKRRNNFCDRSCAATYNNKRKTHGTRRSKLEIWLEEQLIAIYPQLDIHFNRKDAIGSELDMYIPSLKLAVELNGIFHYEPIYGGDTLSRIQENDANKFQQCHANGISLCIIDTSGQKYFKPSTSTKYLKIITDIINMNLS